jgi:hypothetical protein
VAEEEAVEVEVEQPRRVSFYPSSELEKAAVEAEEEEEEEEQ